MVQVMDHHAHAALEELHRRYSKRLLGYFIRMLNRDKDLAQDYVQELFLRLMEKKHLYDPEKKFYSWVFAIASNMCKTSYRHFGKTVSLHPVSHDSGISDESLTEKNEFLNALQQALDELDHLHKDVFVLRYLEHFSLQEIATILEIQVGTVKSRLFNATRKMAARLHDFNPAYESTLFKMN